MSIESIHIPIGFDGPWLVEAGAPSFILQGGVPSMRFAESADEAVKAAFALPEDIDLSVNPKIVYQGFPVAAQVSGSDFRFNNLYEYVGDGEDASSPPSSENLITNFTVSNTISILFTKTDTLDASLISLGDIIMITLEREGINVADDRNGQMAINTVSFVYNGTS